MESLPPGAAPRVLGFYKMRPGPGWRVHNPKPAFVTLSYLLEGRASYCLGEAEYALEPGDVLCVPAGVDKRVRIGRSPALIYSVHFEPSSIAAPDRPLGLPVLLHHGCDARLTALFEEMHLAWLEKEEDLALKIGATFLLIVYELRRGYRVGREGGADARIEAVKRYLLEHLEHPINQKGVAEAVRLNPAYLGVLFRRKVGLTMRGYLSRMRIMKSMDLLATGSYSVTETAYLCGFRDVYYFSRVFHRWTGQAPTVFLRHDQR